MATADLLAGFRVGDWLVEPREQRVSGQGRTLALAPAQLQLLLCLAANHGEVVARAQLAELLWPGLSERDSRLGGAIDELRKALGDEPNHPRYILRAGDDGYALIAHFEPLPAAARALPLPGAKTTLIERLQRLIAELQRRHVLKVAASYLVAMWIVLQVAEVTFQPLHLPGWWLTAITILAVLGLPIVAVLAWSYEITAAGIVLDGSDVASIKLPRARRSLAPVVVTGVALMAGVTGLAWWRSIESANDEGEVPPDPGAPSVAVLPFVDMSPHGGNAYLGDGLSEELSMRLAQIPGLRVAARTSAFEFKDKSLDVRRIGQSLGVRHVLEGSVRRDGGSVRVTAQLVDARTGYHVWAGNFDRDWSDVLFVQDDIARAVTDALKIVLSKSDAASPAKPANFDERAIEPYLAGLALLRQPADQSLMAQAAQHFADAIAVDPSFAGAHAGLCQVEVRRYGTSRDPAQLAAAERSCREAIALDSTLIDTRKALAGLYVTGGKYAEAEATYRSLLQRVPKDADAYIGLGQALEGRGRTAEAEARLRQAVSVEPAFWNAHSALATFLFGRGQIPEAIAEYRKVTALVPSSAKAWSNLGGALQMGGEFAEGADAFRHSLALEPSKDAYSNLATVYFYLGDFPQAVKYFESAVALGAHDQVVLGNLGDALWQVAGRRDEAIVKYRRAIELAQAELAATNGDATVRAQLGYYYGRVGDLETSARYLSQALATGPDILYVQYYRAVAAVDRGDRAAALQAVATLVEHGYPKSLLRSAPEFRSLWQDRRYQELIGVSRAG
ncbi:MAG TPA: tetratricopeptide repeat protein [Steroidobacteraceae bacterium]